MSKSVAEGSGPDQRAEAPVGEKTDRSPAASSSTRPETALQSSRASHVRQDGSEPQNDELTRAHIELDRARAHFLDLYDRAPIAYCTIDERGLIVQVNRTASDLLGVRKDGLLKRPFSAFVAKDDLGRYRGMIEALLEPRDHRSCELRVTKNDGSSLWVNLSAVVAPSADAVARREIRLALTDVSERQQEVAALRETEERYRTAFRLSPNSVTITRLSDGLYQDVNDGFVRTYGWARDEVIGKTVQEIGIWTNPADRQSMIDALQRDGYCESLETELTTRNGTQLAVLVSAHLIMVGDDLCLLAITHDITERKRMMEALREQKEFFHLIAESLNDLIAVLDLDAHLIYASPSYKQFFGSTDELLGTDSFARIHPDDRQRVRSVFDETVRTGQGHQTEYRLKIPDGSFRTMESRSSAIRDREGQVTRVVAVSHDITERKQMEDQVRQMAFHDTLTRLPNRRLFNDRLNQARAASYRSGYYGAVMYLDLDNFKPLNDTHGHNVGDLLLIEVAARLRSCVREMDTVARFGGDEFVVMINELATEKTESIAEAAIIAEKIRRRLAAPYHLTVKGAKTPGETIEHRCTASIGVVVFNNHDTSQDDILKSADTAMYRSKEGGRNSVYFFDG